MSQDLGALLQRGVRYLDVRSTQEFAAGHIPGSFNIPWKLGTLAGLVPNPDFHAVVLANFSKHEPLVVGCRSGSRAAQAAGELELAGFGELWVHADSYEGKSDAFGRVSGGWVRLNLPTESGEPAPRDYSSLRDSLQQRAE